jgi:hypothetical protein
MKNNMILMLAAIIAIFTLVVALYGASVTLMGQAPAAPAAADDVAGLATPAPGNDAVTGADTTNTAFGALSVASADPTVKAWMAAKKIVYVASISSDFCEEGLSDAWTITFASDDGQIMACVFRGEVVDARQSLSSPQQGLDPSKAIDSADIWQKVAGEIQTAGSEAPPTVSMTLKVIGGKPRWDVSYEAIDGYHIVRVTDETGQWPLLGSMIVAAGLAVLIVFVNQSVLAGHSSSGSIMDFPKNEIREMRAEVTSEAYLLGTEANLYGASPADRQSGFERNFSQFVSEARYLYSSKGSDVNVSYSEGLNYSDLPGGQTMDNVTLFLYYNNGETQYNETKIVYLK